MGYRLASTAGTAEYLQSLGLSVDIVTTSDSSRTLQNMIRSGSINMVVNTITRGKEPGREGFKLRRATVEHGIPCLTSIDTAREVLAVSTAVRTAGKPATKAIQDYELLYQNSTAARKNNFMKDICEK